MKVYYHATLLHLLKDYYYRIAMSYLLAKLSQCILNSTNGLVVNEVYVLQNGKSVEGEKKEILQRRDYLVETLVVSPSQVLDEMPSGIDEQFQGEWALYSCSMLSAALSNISSLYPETKEENLRNIDKLIQIIRSSELRKYDSDRWGEDPLSSLSGNQSHVSYLSHQAWMIGSYKAK